MRRSPQVVPAELPYPAPDPDDEVTGRLEREVIERDREWHRRLADLAGLTLAPGPAKAGIAKRSGSERQLNRDLAIEVGLYLVHLSDYVPTRQDADFLGVGINQCRRWMRRRTRETAAEVFGLSSDQLDHLLDMFPVVSFVRGVGWKWANEETSASLASPEERRAVAVIAEVTGQAVSPLGVMERDLHQMILTAYDAGGLEAAQVSWDRACQWREVQPQVQPSSATPHNS
jgi:hypothetical protein